MLAFIPHRQLRQFTLGPYSNPFAGILVTHRLRHSLPKQFGEHITVRSGDGPSLRIVADEGVLIAPPIPAQFTTVIDQPRVRVTRSKSHKLLKAMCWIAGSALATSAMALGVVIPIIAYGKASTVAEQIGKARAESEAIVILDSTGAYGGIRSQPHLAEGHRVVESLSGDVPADFYKMVKWNEDRSTTYFGMNLGALAWAAVCETDRRWIGVDVSSVRPCTGGSGLLTYIHSGIIRGKVANGEKSLSAKASEIITTWSVSTIFDPDAPETMRLIADSATYVTGVGGSIWGVSGAKRALFGPQDTISLAQQAILATAFARPIKLSCSPSADIAPASWKNRVRLAKAMVVNNFGKENPRRIAALSELDQMAPIVRPNVSDPLLAALSPDKKCRASGNPYERATILNSSAAMEAERELTDMGLDKPVTGIVLGESFAEHVEFAETIRASLNQSQSRQSSKLAMRLVSEDGNNADTLLFTTRPDGLITNLYNSSTRDSLNIPRRPASLGKLIILVAAASEGRDPDDLLCNRRDQISHVRNSDGSEGYDCKKNGMYEKNDEGAVTLEYAMANSQSLALLNLARSLKVGSLQRALDAFGGIAPKGVPLPNALALGQFEISPKNMLSGIAAMQRATVGEPVAPLPHVIAKIQIDGKWKAAPTLRGVDLRDLLKTESARRYVVRGASAPMKPGGTLAGAVSFANPLEPGSIGKTGSDTIENGNLTAKFGAGASPAGAFFGGIWAPTGVLGRDLTFIDVWEKVRDAIYADNKSQGGH